MKKEPLFPLLGYNPIFHIEETTRTSEFWINQPKLSKETCRQLRKADIMIVPEGDDYHGKGAYFPEGTVEFYHFLLSQDVSVEVAAEDATFQELARHFNLYILGEFLIKDVALPLFIGLLVEHLKNRLLDPKTSAVKIGVTSQKADGSAKHLTYEGPVNELERSMSFLSREFLSDQPTLSAPDDSTMILPPNENTKKSES